MFDPTSRYYPIEQATHTTEGGRALRYVRRRFLPRGRSIPLLVEHRVEDGERLDLITARTLGDPEQFWQVADANDGMNPRELTEEPGRLLRIPVPQVPR